VPATGEVLRRQALQPALATRLIDQPHLVNARRLAARQLDAQRQPLLPGRVRELSESCPVLVIAAANCTSSSTTQT
jgi:hypothetical protein